MDENDRQQEKPVEVKGFDDGIQNRSKGFDDDIQKSVRELKEHAQALNLAQSEYDYETKDVVKDILLMILFIVIGFGWTMLMLLIISFITLSYIHFEIRIMLLISSGMAVAVGVYCAFGMTRKYKGKRIGRPTRQNRQ